MLQSTQRVKDLPGQRKELAVSETDDISVADSPVYEGLLALRDGLKSRFPFCVIIEVTLTLG